MKWRFWRRTEEPAVVHLRRRCVRPSGGPRAWTPVIDEMMEYVARARSSGQCWFEIGQSWNRDHPEYEYASLHSLQQTYYRLVDRRACPGPILPG